MSDRWFKKLTNNHDTKVIFFCFPHAGGGANAFRSWIEFVPSFIDLFSIQLPGREDRIDEKPVESMQSLIRSITINIISYLNKPCIFIGHSLGGIIAFETARSLKKIGLRQPEHIFIMSRESPEKTDQTITRESKDEDIIIFLREQSGTSSEILNNREILNLFLPMIKSDLYIDSGYFDFYRKSEPLSCPISVFYGDDEKNMTREFVEGWRTETSADFNVEIFSGNHFFLHDNPGDVIKRIIELCKIGDRQ